MEETPPGGRGRPGHAAAGVGLPHGGVDLEACGLKGGVQLPAPVGVEGGVARVGLVDGVVHRIAEDGHAPLPLRQGEGAVLIAQQHGPLVHGPEVVVPLVGDEPLDVLRVQRAVGGGVVIGVPADLDGLAGDAQKAVDIAAVIEGGAGEAQGGGQQKGEHRRQPQPFLIFFLHGLPPKVKLAGRGHGVMAARPAGLCQISCS